MPSRDSNEQSIDPVTEAFKTERQTGEAEAASVELSIPSHVRQHESAPIAAGYVLTETLGEGAYGQVWRAWQLRTRKVVAVKVFTQRTGLDWIFLQREVERLTRLDRHPHIVTMLDTGLEEEPPFYVMDVIEGGALDQFVDPGPPVDPARAMRWMSQICDALSYVHGKGLIHCDLKPANILVDGRDHIRVVDFGQSRVFTESAASIGTLFFMAPEQAQLAEPGSPVQPDVRWDIYALGVSLYAILTGRVPYTTSDNVKSLESAPTLVDRLERYRGLLANDPPPEWNGGNAAPVDEELIAVVNKCMARNPDDRYASVREVGQDLQAMREQRPISPLAGSVGYRARKFVKRNRAALIVALIAVVGLGFAVRASIHSALERTRQEAIAQNEQARRRLSDATVFRDEAIDGDDKSVWGRAAQQFEMALDLAPDNPIALSDYALLKIDMFNRLGRDPVLLAEANALCDRSLAVNAQVSETWNRKGIILKKLERFEESLDAYAKAIELESGNASFLENYGVLAAINHDLATAARTLSEAADLALKQGKRYCNIWQSLAQIRLVQQDAAAIDNVERSVECGPRDADVALAEARVFLSLKGHEDAARALFAAMVAERLAGNDTPRGRINRMLALAHLRNGQYVKAIEYASKALEKGDLATVNHLVISLAHGHLEHPSEARKALNAAEAAWPEDLDEPGEFEPIAPTQTLWIEFADELLELEREAEELLQNNPH